LRTNSPIENQFIVNEDQRATVGNDIWNVKCRRACRPRANENWRIAAMTEVYPSRTLSPPLSIARLLALIAVRMK
jgi:hypothetical protein